MTDFNFKIPEDIHTLFKLISIKKKKDMRIILTKLIINYVKKNRKILKSSYNINLMN